MLSGDIAYLGLVELTRLLHSRQLSPVDVVNAQIERIDTLNGALHGFVRVDRACALDAARRAERDILEGAPLGALHGAPIGVKDNIWTADIETCAGSGEYAGHIPPANAASVDRLLAAGAVVLGKLTTTEFAGATYDPAISVPINPWNPSKWPGASSSGSAVALAAGLCHGALGTDTAGSIRFPAAVNGVVGLKPTWGRVSSYGMFHSIHSMDHIGPMARNIEDVEALFSAMDIRRASRGERDFASRSASRPLAGLRLGVDRTFGFDDADAATRGAMEATLARLEILGAEIVEVRFPDHSGWMEAMTAIHAREGTHYKEMAAIALSDEAALRMNEQYRHAIEWRGWLCHNISDLFTKIDVLMTPVLPMSDLGAWAGDAMESDAELLGNMLRYIVAFSFTGSPTLVVPAGLAAEGTPLGVQFAAAWGDEDRLFEVGRALQHATGFDRLRPPRAPD